MMPLTVAQARLQLRALKLWGTPGDAPFRSA